jgi:hypothetical protein
MITYHRDCYVAEALEEVKDHVVGSLSAMASETDDPREFAEEVVLEVIQHQSYAHVSGSLDRYPTVYDLDDYEEPARNRAQQGFGERMMTPLELQEHMIAKAAGQ